MRCLALAQAWRQGGGRCLFVSRDIPPELKERLQSESIEIGDLQAVPGSQEDASAVLEAARRSGASFGVVDGYHFSSEYQKILKKSNFGFLFIDDYGHARDYCADIVLNQNAYAEPSLYARRDPATTLLLGSRFALLRQEFAQWKTWKRVIAQTASKVLVTLGGGDHQDAELKILNSLKRSKIKMEIRTAKNAKGMAEILSWADIAVTAAGSTCWEAAFLGLPSLVIPLAENQLKVAQWLDQNGVAQNLGGHADITEAGILSAFESLALDQKKRETMSRRGRDLIDGKGAERVCLRIKSRLMTLRRISAQDSRLLWDWNNQPDVRAASFSTSPIPWENHTRWFDSKLEDPRSLILVAHHVEGSPLGQVRYEKSDGEAVVSVVVDSKFRGKGYGSAILCRSAEEAFKILGVNAINAYVKESNPASCKAFINAGFTLLGKKRMYDQEVAHLVLNKAGIS